MPLIAQCSRHVGRSGSELWTTVLRSPMSPQGRRTFQEGSYLSGHRVLPWFTQAVVLRLSLFRHTAVHAVAVLESRDSPLLESAVLLETFHVPLDIATRREAPALGKLLVVVDQSKVTGPERRMEAGIDAHSEQEGNQSLSKGGVPK